MLQSDGSKQSWCELSLHFLVLLASVAQNTEASLQLNSGWSHYNTLNLGFNWHFHCANYISNFPLKLLAPPHCAILMNSEFSDTRVQPYNSPTWRDKVGSFTYFLNIVSRSTHCSAMLHCERGLHSGWDYCTGKHTTVSLLTYTWIKVGKRHNGYWRQKQLEG